MRSFLEEIGERPIIGDADPYSLLVEAGSVAPEQLVVDGDPRVSTLIKASTSAGLEFVRTPTLKANRIHLEPVGLLEHVTEVNWQAAQQAKAAAAGKSWVAGVVGPIPDVDRSAARDNIQLVMGGLLDGRCDLICLQGFEHVSALQDAIEIKQTLHHCPVVCVLESNEGTPPLKLAYAAAEAGAEVIVLPVVEGKKPNSEVEELLEEGVELGILLSGDDDATDRHRTWEIWREFGARLLIGNGSLSTADMASFVEAD